MRLTETRPAEEVTGFLEADLEEFQALVQGLLPGIRAEAVSKDNLEPHATTISSNALALYSAQVKETFTIILQAVRQVLTGGVPDKNIFL